MKNIKEIDINVIKRLRVVPVAAVASNDTGYHKEDYTKSLLLVQKAASYRSALDGFLQKIKRNRNIYMGKQWEDIVVVDGETYTAKELYKKMGKNPMNINVVQSTVRNIIGQYRKGEYKPIIASQNREGQQESEMMTVALQSVLNENNMHDRNARQLELFILTGFPVYKITYSYDHLLQRPKVLVRAVSAQKIIINPEARDLFGEDINFIGEIHDYSHNDMMSMYGNNVGEEKINEICLYNKDKVYGEYQTFTSEELDELSVLRGNGMNNSSRVLEIWQLEGEYRIEYHDRATAEWGVVKYSELGVIQSENYERLRMGQEQGVEVPLISFKKRYYKFWKTYHISLVDYSILYEGETPYAHLSHPYVFYCYPGIDGQVCGLSESLNDIQLLFSRNIMLQDMLISTSAKNLLVIPKSTLEASKVTAQQVANQWVKSNGVIVLDYDNARKPLPVQLSTTPGAQIGINNIIQSTMQLLREVSGVKDSMLGDNPKSGEPYSSYYLSSANASINIADLIEGFNTFTNKTYEKAIKLIKQFWTERQYVNVAGIEASDFARNYDPEAIREFEFTSVIAQGENTAVMRDIVTKELMGLLANGLVSFEMFLEHGNSPYAEKMLQTIKRYREELAEGKHPEGVPQWLLAEYQGMQQQGNFGDQSALDDFLKNGGDVENLSPMENGIGKEVPPPQNPRRPLMINS